MTIDRAAVEGPSVLQVLRRARTLIFDRVSRGPHRLLFAFTGGMGAWPEMGRSLYRRNRAFRESIDASNEVIEQMLGWSGASAFRGEDPQPQPLRIERRNEIVHLGMLQIAQVDLWRSAGIRPGGVVSVSLGEMVAPYAAGALSREDSARVLAAVAQAVSRTPGDERMFIVSAAAAKARALVRAAPAHADYLGSMTPGQSVLLTRETDAATVRAFLGDLVLREIATDWNYHAPRLELERDWFVAQLRSLQSLPPRCPIYSSAAGGLVPPGAPFDTAFYLWMVSHPFRYADAVGAALRDGFDTIVTLGPHPANNAYIRETAAAMQKPVALIDTMRATDEIAAWGDAVQSVRSRGIVRATPRPVGAPAVLLGDEERLAFYERLRRNGTVHHLAQDAYWLVIGYDDVQRALVDPRFSSRFVEHQQLDPHLLGADPPGHTGVRRIIGRLFSPDAVERRTAQARAVAERLLQPIKEGRELDVVHDLADPWASAVAADIIGLRGEEQAAILARVAAVPGDVRSLFASLSEPVKRLKGRIALYDDLRREGFDDDAARSLVRLLWVAGMTPRHALAPAVFLLLQHEDVRTRVQNDPSLLGAFVDETLRLHPPTHLVPRRTTAEVSIGGKTIPAGEVVQLSLAAANRDPERFEDPAALRLDRSGPAHLSFGGGVHRCVGASLGRAMLISALEALLTAAPAFRAVQPLGTVRYAAGTALREIEQLVIGP